jgi:hypothetical protein
MVKLNVLRLEVAPALDFGLIAVFREALKVFGGQLPGGVALARELLAGVGVSWHLLRHQRPKS